MKRTRHATERIIEKLRLADVALDKGQKVPEIFKSLEIAEQTYFRWWKEYDGLRTDQAKRMKVLEDHVPSGL